MTRWSLKGRKFIFLVIFSLPSSSLLLKLPSEFAHRNRTVLFPLSRAVEGPVHKSVKKKKKVRILVDKSLNCDDLLCIYFFSLRIKYMTFIYSSHQKYIDIPFPVFPATSLILSLLYLVINAYKSDLDVGQYQIKLSV